MFHSNLVNNSKNLVNLPSPVKINYLWKFGSLLGLVYSVQVISGMILSFHFMANIPFESVDTISREIPYGSNIRFAHIFGASLFFFCVYFHSYRGVRSSSYIHNPVLWLSGVSIFVFLMAISFLGYVLPFGQSSYWGATVMTNFLSVISFDLVKLLWGGFSVKTPTVVRFFSLHYILPLVLGSLISVHLVLVHVTGSSNPTPLPSVESVSFHPYFSWKDLLGGFFFFMGVYFFLYCDPILAMEVQNFESANPLVTPSHIQPEWYFLPAYAVLRAIPKKLGGVISLVFFVLVWAFFPLFRSPKKVSSSPPFLWAFYGWLSCFFILWWLGAKPVEDPFLWCSRLATFFYFFYFVYLYGFFRAQNITRVDPRSRTFKLLIKV